MSHTMLFGVLPDGIFAWRNVNGLVNLPYALGSIIRDLDERSKYGELDICWQMVVDDVRPKAHIAFEIWEAGQEGK